jgi:hypothetical protein
MTAMTTAIFFIAFPSFELLEAVAKLSDSPLNFGHS